MRGQCSAPGSDLDDSAAPFSGQAASAIRSRIDCRTRKCCPSRVPTDYLGMDVVTVTRRLRHTRWKWNENDHRISCLITTVVRCLCLAQEKGGDAEVAARRSVRALAADTFPSHGPAPARAPKGNAPQCMRQPRPNIKHLPIRPGSSRSAARTRERRQMDRPR